MLRTHSSNKMKMQKNLDIPKFRDVQKTNVENLDIFPVASQRQLQGLPLFTVVKVSLNDKVNTHGKREDKQKHKWEIVHK